jgi:hypothetical protein
MPARAIRIPENPPPGSINPGQTGTPGGKEKQDAPQNQKR